MAKHIGIVACSAEGAALCYRTICGEAPREMGAHNHPEITMHTHALSDYMAAIRAGDWRGVAGLMLSSAKKVAEAGADFALSPDNTIHQAFELLMKESPIPWLHIARVVAEEAGRKGYSKLAVLGTKYLMTGPVYPDALEKSGIGHAVPDETARSRIDEIIFTELVYGRFPEDARRYFNEVIDVLRTRGCDAVVLGCTEIPLLVDPADCPLPTLDSTRLLARAAVREALKDD
jgi:aspartate racemase